jgi:hypothetical protein
MELRDTTAYRVITMQYRLVVIGTTIPVIRKGRASYSQPGGMLQHRK